MMKPLLLDCTLRDGGYYTQWDFDKTLVETYCRAMEKMPIDYVEVGYRSISTEGYLGEYFYCPEYLLKHLKELMPSKKLAIILNEKDTAIESVPQLLDSCKGTVRLVRLAIAPVNIRRAISLAKEIKKRGFEVAFNVMYLSSWKENLDFLNSIKEIKSDFVDYFYMVDSYGGMTPVEIKEIISLVKEKTNVAFGFHGHNNLELALANTLESIQAGVKIVDMTITGMGRGAGNLKTELLLTFLDSKDFLSIDHKTLSQVVTPFNELQKKHEWGSSLPYAFSGAHSLPQKEVMEWVALNRYSLRSILNALKNKKEKKQDNQRFPIFRAQYTYSKILLVGGGPLVQQHFEGLEKYLDNNPDILIIHAGTRFVDLFNNLKNTQYYALVGNEVDKLLKQDVDLKIISGNCIIPPYPRTMGTDFPKELEKGILELKSVDFTEESKESPLTVALQLALSFSVKEIQLVGFDGYQMSTRAEHFFIAQENQRIFQDVQNGNPEISIVSLTPTRYRDISVKSVYSLIQ